MSIVKKILAWLVAKLKALFTSAPVVVFTKPMPAPVVAPVVPLTTASPAKDKQA